MKKFIAFIVALTLVAAMFAVPALAEEKVLTFGCQMYSDGLVNPAAQINCAWNCMRYGISEGLFKFNDNMEIEPWLAESWEANEDSTVWTIVLRDGVKFSNGADMTASKVKESLDSVREHGPDGSSNPQNYLPFEAEVVADDAANTITITLPKPDYNLPGNLAYPVMAIINVSDTTDFDHGVIGTGPYMVESHADLVGYTMAANPNYWGGEVPYDKVEIIFMGDASAKANALMAGQVDLVENITNVSDLQRLQADDNYTVDIASGVRCGFSWINFKGILGNDTLRKAIVMGIDNPTICESNTIGGLYTTGFSVLPSTLAYGYENLVNPYAYDPDAAAAMLDEAGIVDSDGDGVRELDGQPIFLRYSSYENRLLNDFSDANTMYMAELGIGVNPAYGSSDDCWNDLVTFNYDLDNNNWTTVGNGDPTEYMANWYGKSGSNYCGYQNDAYDAAYEKFLETPDAEGRAALLQEMQQILIDDAAVIIDGYYNSSMAYSKNVGHAHIHTADYYWLSTEITPAE